MSQLGDERLLTTDTHRRTQTKLVENETFYVSLCVLEIYK